MRILTCRVPDPSQFPVQPDRAVCGRGPAHCRAGGHLVFFRRPQPSRRRRPSCKQDRGSDRTRRRPTATSTRHELKALTDQNKYLAKTLASLQEKVDKLPRPEPAPDLAPIQKQLADLTAKLGAFDQRIQAVADGLAGAQAELTTLKAEPVKGTEPATAAASSGDTALAEAAAQFQQTRYAEALASFRKLQAAAPDDARVWYFSALANGLVRRQWTAPETLQWVKKGVECEKAGNPERARIDEAFAGLSAATGKDWLAGYRKQAK